MGSRVREKGFVDRSFASIDHRFFANNCQGCHLRGCLDCHGGDGHKIARPRDRQCLACHSGYFVGSEYYGMAPREDNFRYQRGEKAYGRDFLKMAPDIHAEAGISCAKCHTMTSLAAGRKSAKGCRECHVPSRRVLEHRITAHLDRMECYACHSAWAPQEYGTFFLRFISSPSRENFDLPALGTEYLKSAYLRSQDPPPLGLNSRGLVSPIRPEFIAYYSEIRKNRPVGKENRLLAAEWKAFFPHTIQRGTVMCEGCHENPRRFLLESEQDRIYRLREDGMTLSSFWDRSGQRVVNGSFMPMERYDKLSTKKPAYRKAVVEKWQRLVKRVAPSSHP
jgi:hypothetical protein